MTQPDILLGIACNINLYLGYFYYTGKGELNPWVVFLIIMITVAVMAL